MLVEQPAPTVPAPVPYQRNRAQLLLLMVEPVAEQLQILETAFARQFTVVATDNTADALLAAGHYQPDVVLAAARLGEISCECLVSTLGRHRRLPIVVGMGADDGELAAAAMRAGATACVARPYRIPELTRLLTSLRPAQLGLDSVERGPILLDPQAQQVFLYGRTVDLPLQECHLLHLLMSQSERVVTREEIRQQLWPGLPDERSNTITVHIRRLRMRLGDHAWHPTIITTVRGKGYRFTAPPPLVPA